MHSLSLPQSNRQAYRKEHGSWRRRRGALLRLGLLHLDGLGLVPELLALLHHVLPQAVEVVPRVLEERVLQENVVLQISFVRDNYPKGAEGCEEEGKSLLKMALELLRASETERAIKVE